MSGKMFAASENTRVGREILWRRDADRPDPDRLHTRRLHCPVGDGPMTARGRNVIDAGIDEGEGAGSGENDDREQGDDDNAHQNQLRMPKRNCTAPVLSPSLRARSAVWPNFPAQATPI